MIDGIVAIVGRPNVGKSSLFNRMIGDRKSIVDDTPGVTRDRIYGTVTWLTKELRVIDTGGLQIQDQPFQVEIKMQVEIALEEADVIVFVVDGMQGVTTDDQFIAKMLHRSKKKVILAANKIDDIQYKANIYEFYGLGFDEPIAVSTAHGIGLGDVLDAVIENLPTKGKNINEGKLAFSIIGQPNVGKSSLVNALLNQDRVIVSTLEGTTRDAIDTPFIKDNQEYVVIDTAGIRKRGKVYENIEKYSVLRAMSAIERSDVVLFLIDGEKGIRAQDKHVAGYAHEAGKPVIIIYNKWDMVDKEEQSTDSVSKKIREEFLYLSYAPILFVSALTKQRVTTILPMVETVYDNSLRRIQTNVFNDVLSDALMLTPPPLRNGKPLKVYYGSQVSIAPPTFVLFINNRELMHFSYLRYLENRFREAFDFMGTPIHFVLKEKGELG